MITSAHLDLKRHLWIAETDPAKRARLAIEYGDAIRKAPQPEPSPQPVKPMRKRRVSSSEKSSRRPVIKHKSEIHELDRDESEPFLEEGMLVLVEDEWEGIIDAFNEDGTVRIVSDQTGRRYNVLPEHIQPIRRIR